ncbi:unnamed protein product [Lota lota]
MSDVSQGFLTSTELKEALTALLPSPTALYLLHPTPLTPGRSLEVATQSEEQPLMAASAELFRELMNGPPSCFHSDEMSSEGSSSTGPWSANEESSAPDCDDS